MVLIAACSGDDDDDSASPATAASTSTPTTLAPAEAAQAYTGPGPHPVGVTTLELDGGVPVEVWYPAVDGSSGEDSYDMRALVPQTVRDLLTADVPAVYTYDATRDGGVADGEFSLVLFSHGASGVRQQSTFLTAHLASWGMVVAAPDHWSRDLYHSLDRVLGGPAVNANDSVDDLRLTRTLIETENGTAGSRFEGHIDTGRVGAVGHSAGGGTVLQLAGDEDINGYVSMASGALLGRGGAPDSSTTTAPEVDLPDVPSLFLAGRLDAIASWETVTKRAFDAAPAPTRLWVIDGMGHNGFDDFCTFGNGSGIIGVAVASGLGGLLDAQPQFRRLGEDGCLPPAVAVTDTFPIVEHSVTAFLREVFGEDATPVGLGPEVADQYAVPVTIEEKL